VQEGIAACNKLLFSLIFQILYAVANPFFAYGTKEFDAF
jgi:hypothetical protein